MQDVESVALVAVPTPEQERELHLKAGRAALFQLAERLRAGGREVTINSLGEIKKIGEYPVEVLITLTGNFVSRTLKARLDVNYGFEEGERFLEPKTGFDVLRLAMALEEGLVRIGPRWDRKFQLDAEKARLEEARRLSNERVTGEREILREEFDCFPKYHNGPVRHRTNRDGISYLSLELGLEHEVTFDQAHAVLTAAVEWGVIKYKAVTVEVTALPAPVVAVIEDE